MELITIKEYTKGMFENGTSKTNIGVHLGVSPSMVTQYMNYQYNPSLAVAKLVYIKEGIVLHPFAKDSLIKEIENV